MTHVGYVLHADFSADRALRYHYLNHTLFAVIVCQLYVVPDIEANMRCLRHIIISCRSEDVCDVADSLQTG